LEALKLHQSIASRWQSGLAAHYINFYPMKIRCMLALLAAAYQGSGSKGSLQAAAIYVCQCFHGIKGSLNSICIAIFGKVTKANHAAQALVPAALVDKALDGYYAYGIFAPAHGGSHTKPMALHSSSHFAGGTVAGRSVVGKRQWVGSPVHLLYAAGGYHGGGKKGCYFLRKKRGMKVSADQHRYCAKEMRKRLV
jgi:hypothetical protein